MQANGFMDEYEDTPVLRFSPTAWAKLLYFRDKTDNEVGGFGITDPDDLLFVKEFVTVKQKVSCVSVCFDDDAVADYFDEQVDFGRKPEQFARCWLHTHPGGCAGPSGTDEDTFKRVFGNCHWAVMFILSQDNQIYARLRFNVGPCGEVLIPVEVDYNSPFEASDQNQWKTEHENNVKPERHRPTVDKDEKDFGYVDLDEDDPIGGFIDELEEMDYEERMLLLDEIAQRPDLLEQDSEEVLI